MKKTVTSSEAIEQWDTLVSDVAQDGDEVVVTVDGVPVLKLVPMAAQEPHINDGPMAGSVLYEGDVISPLYDKVTATPPLNGRVLYKGEWMSAAGAERERSIEHLRGSVKILGDIVSPIDDVEYDALK